MSDRDDRDHEIRLPPVGADGLRHWAVAGGVIVEAGELLLVENLRRNGRRDWSTPGGVIDPGETPIEALTREVEEETGLTVAEWSGPVYHVEVLAPDAGFLLQVEAHRAVSYSGEIRIEDPDGIVTAAEFVSTSIAAARLAEATPWVAEPLLAHLHAEVGHGHRFRYRVDGGPGDDRVVTRLDRQ